MMNQTYRSFYQKFKEDVSKISLQLERIRGCDTIGCFTELYDEIAVYAQYDPRRKTGIRLPTLPKGSRDRLVTLVDVMKDKAEDLYDRERGILSKDIGLIADRDSYELRDNIYSRCSRLSSFNRLIDGMPSDLDVVDCTEFHRHLLGYLDEFNAVKDSYEGWNVSVDDIGLRRSEIAGTRHDIEVLVYRYSRLPTCMGKRYSDVSHWYREIKKLDRAIRRIPKNRLYLRELRMRSRDQAPVLETGVIKGGKTSVRPDVGSALPDRPEYVSESIGQDSRTGEENVIPLFRPPHPQVAPVNISFTDNGSLYTDITFCSEILDVKPSTERVKEWQDILSNADSTRNDLTTRFTDFHESLSQSSQLTGKEIQFLSKLKSAIENDSALKTLCSTRGHLPDTINKSVRRIDQIRALAG